MPVSFAVCSKTIHIHLIAYMECKYHRKKACGRVSSMILKPVFIDVFDKGWIVNQDLFFSDFDFPWNRKYVKLIVPVVRAVTIQRRSRVLKGITIMLTFSASSL